MRVSAGVAFACAALAAGSIIGSGGAAAQTGGIALYGVQNGDCTATIKLTNYTNSTYFQPDWWFEQENDQAMVDATTIPADMPAPWREVSGIPWPMARWVGDPPLASAVADGIPTFPGATYNRNAQPDGLVAERTLDLRAERGTLQPASDGTMTIFFRVRSGPVTADRLPNPQQLIVQGCGSGGGGSAGSSGSANGS